MTIEELYKWAVKRGIENFTLYINDEYLSAPLETWKIHIESDIEIIELSN